MAALPVGEEGVGGRGGGREGGGRPRGGGGGKGEGAGLGGAVIAVWKREKKRENYEKKPFCEKEISCFF